MIEVRKIGFILLAVLLISFAAFGKTGGSLTGDGHSGDMTRVLGLDVSIEAQRVFAQSITRSFARLIDSREDASELNREIKKIAPGFSWGHYTHRIFFHWGFNGDPRKSYALNDRIRTSGASEEQIQEIWKLILDVQAKRNTYMMKSIIDAIEQKNHGSCSLTRDEINALASIVYDVHILGDYVEGTEAAQLAIQSVDVVCGDLIKASRKIGGNNYGIVNSLQKEINRAKMSGVPSQKAKKVIEVLEKNIPLLLRSSSRLKSALY